MSATPDIDCIVIGAGVVGLATARALARAGRETLVLEAEGGIGRGVSSRNSEVIHAGIYYPPGSAKARLCVEGRRALYDFCAAYGVPHRKCGKLLVASDESQRAQVLSIRERASRNGVTLDVLERDALAAMEPQLRGVLALHSSETGIVDSHALMVALQGDAQAHGADFAFHAPVVRARRRDGVIEIDCGGPEPMSVTAAHVVLAAGLSSPRVARSFEGLRGAPDAFFAKGSYFSLARRSPFSRLVYPVPEPGGLGVHLTLDLAGRARFGPDVEWLDATHESEIDYRVDPGRCASFHAAIRRYWPDLRDDDLIPDYSGVRPKIVGPRVADADFAIHDARTHGIDGLVALYGIESPGLTASLAIADHAARLALGADASPAEGART